MYQSFGQVLVRSQWVCVLPGMRAEMVSYLCDICGDICDICGTGGVIQDPANLDVLFMTLGTITVHGSLINDF